MSNGLKYDCFLPSLAKWLAPFRVQERILAGPAARAPFRGRGCGQLLGAGSSISVLARELKHAITPCFRAKFGKVGTSGGNEGGGWE